MPRLPQEALLYWFAETRSIKLIRSTRFAGRLSSAATISLSLGTFALFSVLLSIAVEAQTIPDAPSNLVATAVSPFQINLSWSDASTNENGFKVERSLDGTNFTQIAQVLPNTTNYRNSGLFPNAGYFYRVRAFNAAGNSAFSSVATAGTALTLCPLSVAAWGYTVEETPLGLVGPVAIASGSFHNLALQSDGTVVGWGDNSYDQAMPPAGLTGVVAVAAGGYQSLALKSNGTVVGWGTNFSTAVTPPAGVTGVVAIASGYYHNLALKGDGTVVAWGTNFYGEAMPPAGLTGVVAVAAGGYQSLALKSDGTVVGWGTNFFTAVMPPAGVTGVVALAAGFYHGLALKSDGTVVGWGYDDDGEATPPPGLTGVVAIAAGGFHSLALKGDGTVVGWGYDGFGEATSPAGLAGVVAISAGDFHNLALTTTPGVPSSLAAIAIATNQVNLSWVDTSGNEIGFKIERAPDDDFSPGTWTQIGVVTANVTNFSDTGVVSNATYWYRVRSYDNTCGDSVFSLPVTVSVAPPAAPLYPTAILIATNQVDLFWYDNSFDETGFKIERAFDAGGSPGLWAQIAAVGAGVTDYSDTGVTTNTTYWYRVRAYNGVGDSDYSDSTSVSVAQPVAPSSLTATNELAGQIDLAWVNTSNTASGFKIERAPDNAGSPGTWAQIADVGIFPTAYNDTGLEPGKTYWYRVRAYNAIGDSLYSNEASAFVRDGLFVRVMQWNVERNLGQSYQIFTAQAQAIARIVNYNRPDILLFNEINTQGITASDNRTALINWVVNNVPYFNANNFYVAVSSQTDGFIRNAAISRYPIETASTYNDGLRGTHSFKVRLSGANALQVFHAHIKCCSDDCARKHFEAQFDADTISAWASTNTIPYLFAGDWNDDEQSPLCSPPNTIRTIREGSGLVEFKPTTLDGEYRTWSTSSASIRFDYMLAATNRLAPLSGYVFSSTVWANHGLYNGFSNDSLNASDHYCVFADYILLDPHFTVTVTNAFASIGIQGGPFVPTNRICILSNVTASSVSWVASNSVNWLTASPASGTLVAGSSIIVTQSINSAANVLSPGSYAVNTIFQNTTNGGFATASVNLTVLWPPPVVNFTGSPTNGLEPLAVTFTDTSTGSITNHFWNFGDGATTNVTTNVVAHTYTAGTYAVATYDVIQLVSGIGGVGTNAKPNYITVRASPSTINIEAANLQDGSGNLATTGTVAVLVADTSGNGFANPQSSFSLSLGATWGTDDKVVGLWDLRNSVNCSGSDGDLCGEMVVTYTNGIAPGQKLQLYWFPSLTLASGTLGITSYGKYTDTNNPAVDGSNKWQIPTGGSTVYLLFYTAYWGGSNPETAGRATLLTSAPVPAFESWQIQYFGDTNNPAAASGADPDGDGQSNMAEFLAGTDPTNSVSALRITSIAPEGNSLRITWITGNNRTNALQAKNEPAGGYTTNGFANIFVVINTVGPVTNYLDGGAATNIPSRYYRIRLVP